MRCCVPGCEEKGASLHRFPLKDPSALKIWIERIGNEKLTAVSASDVLSRNRVCARHFSFHCFSPGSRKLNNGSLPTLFLPLFKSPSTRENSLLRFYKIEIDQENPRTLNELNISGNLIQETGEVEEQQDSNSKQDENVYDQEIADINKVVTPPSTSNLNNSGEFSKRIFNMEDYLSMDIEQFIDNLQCQSIESHKENSIDLPSDGVSPLTVPNNNINTSDKTNFPPEPPVLGHIDNESISFNSDEMRAQYENLMKQNEILLKQKNDLINGFKDMFVLLKNKLKDQNTELIFVKTELEKFDHLVSRVFTINQLKILLNETNVHWTPKEILMGFTIRYLSRKTYHLLKEKLSYPLPSMGIILKWLSSISKSQCKELIKMIKLLFPNESQHENDELYLLSHAVDDLDIDSSDKTESSCKQSNEFFNNENSNLKRPAVSDTGPMIKKMKLDTKHKIVDVLKISTPINSNEMNQAIDETLSKIDHEYTSQSISNNQPTSLNDQNNVSPDFLLLKLNENAPESLVVHEGVTYIATEHYLLGQPGSTSTSQINMLPCER